MPEFIGVHLSERHPGVATATLTREPTNALTRQAWRELAAAAAEVSRRTDIASGMAAVNAARCFAGTVCSFAVNFSLHSNR